MPITLTTGFKITNRDPIDSRIVVADQAARLSFAQVNVFEGLVTYQEDTNELFVLTDKSNWNQTSGWTLIGSATGSLSTGSLLTTASIAGNDLTFTKGNGDTFTIVLPSGSSGSGSGFPFSGSAVITGSLEVTGSITASAGVVNQLTSSYAISSSYALSSSVSDQAESSTTSSFIPFDGNRAISNLDLSIGGNNLAIYGENFGTNGLADFIDQVFFKNTGPTISTTGFTIQEYLPSSSVVGTVSATDPEGQNITFSTSSTYTDDFFRIHSSSGVVTMNVKSTSSMNTFNDSGTLKAPFPIVATDTGNLTGSKTLYIRVVPNTAPKWSITQNSGDLSEVTSSLSESSAIGNDKHRYYYRDDEDNNSTITINSGSFSSNFLTDFRLVNVTGITYPYVRLDQINNVDFDTYPSYSFALTASDEHYVDGDDPNSQTILPVELKILDNLPPTVGNQNLSGVREDACVGLSSTSAGTVVATDNDGTTMTVTEFVILSAYMDGVGTNVTSSLGGTSVFDASADPFVINPATRAVTLDSGKFLNSDQANRYVYRVTIRDNFNPISSSAEVTVFVQDAPVNTLTTSPNFNIIESARTSELVKQSAAGIGGSNSTSTAANSSTQNWIVNSTPDFIEATNITASSTTFQLKSDLSGSATVGGDTITIQVTASQDNFPTSIQYFEKTIDVKSLVAPTITVTDFTDNQNTNGARPGGQNLTRLNITDGQPVTARYDIDNSTFQFTPNAGQNLVAYRDTSVTGTTARYFVSASSNLAAGTYGYTASIENVRGFRSGEIKDSFTVAQAGTGTLNGNTTSYVIESATSSMQIKSSTNGYTGAQADLGVTYGSTGYNGAIVQSFTSSNAFIAINNSGQLSVGNDISGSYTSGQTITSTITFRDQYDNIGTGTATVDITNNVAPTVSYSDVSGGLTGSQTSGTKVGTISVSDSQGENITSLTLSGADQSSFALGTAPAPGSSRSWDLNVGASTIQTGSYALTGSGKDQYGQTTNLPIDVVISAPIPTEIGYVYTMEQDNTVGNVLGYPNTNSATPPVPNYSSTVGLLYRIIDNDTLGDATISYDYVGTTYTAVRTLSNNGTTPDEIISGSNLGDGDTTNNFKRVLLFVPSSGDLEELPTSFTDADPVSSNTTTGQYVNFVAIENSFQGSSAGPDNDIKATTALSITLGTAVNGHTNWYVYVTTDRFNSSNGDIYMRMLPANAASGSLPS